jgi:hypothetical protein
LRGFWRRSLRGWRKDIGLFRRSWKGDEKERNMGGGWVVHECVCLEEVGRSM